MTRTKSIYLALLAVLLSPMVANADPLTVVNEQDIASDTGHVPSTASILFGDGPLTQINGVIDGDSRRVDMYGIQLSVTDLFGAYTEITDGDPGTLSIFLFDDRGHGIAAAFYGRGAGLLNIVPTYTGLHYIAVAQMQTLQPYALIDPIHNSTLPIFITETAFGYHIPGGAAADLPVSSWGGTVSGNFRAYSLFLQGSSFVPTPTPDPEPDPQPAPVPEPSTLALLGLGLVGMAARRRKKV